MKKRILIFISIIVSAFYVVRLYTLNSKEHFPIILEYDNNQEVEFENDFFDYSEENMNGYSITLTNSELMTIDEFISNYAIQDKEIFHPFNYVCLLKVNVKNKSNKDEEKSGLNLKHFMLQSGAYMTYPNTDAFAYVNDIDFMQFSLRYNSDKDFIIPFLIYNGNVDINTFKKMSPQLVVSLFPHKKVIKI